MGIDVYVQDMENRVALPYWQAARAKAYESHVTAISEDHVGLTLRSGDEVELFDQGRHPGCMVSIPGAITPAICDFLFDLMDLSELFIMPASAEPRALRSRKNPRPPFPEPSLKELEIENGAGLFAFLTQGANSVTAAQTLEK